MALLNPLARASALAPFLTFGRRPAPPAPGATTRTPEEPGEAAPQGGATGEGNPNPQGGATGEGAANPQGGGEPPKTAAKGGETKPKAEEEEEEDERDREEMRGDSPVTQARVRERARCAAILTHPAAAANMPLAMQLAFGSRMGRQEACATLAAAGPAAKPDASSSPLGTLMGGLSGLRPGADAPPSVQGAAAIMGSWDAAAERAGVRRKA